MQITKDKVVTIDYTLKDDNGKVLDASEGGDFAYLHGARNVIPGLEKALTGKSSGDELNISVPPEEGYGIRDPGMTHTLQRSMFQSDEEIEAGMQFYAEGPDGQMVLVTIIAVDGDVVTVDGNHPLAGLKLNFQVKVVEVRDATAAEIKHGHVHRPGEHKEDG